MRTRVMTLAVEVRVPVTTGESEVADAVNAVLDEPPCDWGDWVVGAAVVTGVRVEESEEEAP